MMFEQIKKYYDKGIYTKDMVHKFVEKGFITEEQYEGIVGENND